MKGGHVFHSIAVVTITLLLLFTLPLSVRAREADIYGTYLPPKMIAFEHLTTHAGKATVAMRDAIIDDVLAWCEGKRTDNMSLMIVRRIR